MGKKIPEKEENGNGHTESVAAEPIKELKQEQITTKSDTIEDILMMSGMFRSNKADPLLQSLQKEKDSLIEAEKVSFKFDINVIENAIKDLETAKVKSQEELRALRKKRDELTTQVVSSRSRYWELKEKINGLVYKLLSRRTTYPQKLYNRKTELFSKLSADVSERILKEEQQKLECEKILHNLAIERKKLNEPEFNRRIELLEKRRKKVEERFNQHDDYITSLRRYGITRTTAGFLVWAGYLAFTAFGWYIGEIIQRLHQSGVGFIQLLFGQLSKGIISIINSLGPGLGIVTVMLFPLLLIASFFVVFMLTDKLLGRIDPFWDDTEVTTNPKKTKTDWSFWTWINNPNKRLLKSDYTQILAKLPLIYLWFIVPLFIAVFFGLAGGGARTAITSGIPDPWLSILYTYLGVVLCITVSAFVLLYCSKVIEPRLRRHIESGDTNISFWKLNIEFVLVVILFLGLFFFSGLITLVVPDFSGIWAGTQTLAITTLIIMGSFVISYGLLYRGIFRDYDALKREMGSYENAMEKYSAFPVVEIRDEELRRYSSELKKLQDEINNVWSNADYWSKPSTALGFFKPTRSIFRAIFPRQKNSNQDNEIIYFINADELLETELVSEINKLNSELRMLKNNIVNMDKSIDEVNTTISELKTMDWNAQINSLKKQKQEREREYYSNISQISKNYAKVIASADTAHKMGVSLRGSLLRK